MVSPLASSNLSSRRHAVILAYSGQIIYYTMTSTAIKCFFLSVLVSYSSACTVSGMKNHVAWQVNLALMAPLISNYFFLQVEGAAPPEQSTKLKHKIKKGKELLEDLNDSLEKIKENMKEKKNVDKSTVDKIVKIKDDFTKLKVDPDDLSRDLIEKFKEKTLEAFSLIVANFGGLDKLIPKKADAPTDNRVDGNKVDSFQKEL